MENKQHDIRNILEDLSKMIMEGLNILLDNPGKDNRLYDEEFYNEDGTLREEFKFRKKK